MPLKRRIRAVHRAAIAKYEPRGRGVLAPEERSYLMILTDVCAIESAGVLVEGDCSERVVAGSGCVLLLEYLGEGVVVKMGCK